MPNSATVKPLFVNAHRPHTSSAGNSGYLVELVTKEGARLITWAGTPAELAQYPLGQPVTCLVKKVGDNYDINPTEQASALSAFLNS